MLYNLKEEQDIMEVIGLEEEIMGTYVGRVTIVDTIFAEMPVCEKPRAYDLMANEGINPYQAKQHSEAYFL